MVVLEATVGPPASGSKVTLLADDVIGTLRPSLNYDYLIPLYPSFVPLHTTINHNYSKQTTHTLLLSQYTEIFTTSTNDTQFLNTQPQI